MTSHSSLFRRSDAAAYGRNARSACGTRLEPTCTDFANFRGVKSRGARDTPAGRARGVCRPVPFSIIPYSLIEVGTVGTAGTTLATVGFFAFPVAAPVPGLVGTTSRAEAQSAQSAAPGLYGPFRAPRAAWSGSRADQAPPGSGCTLRRYHRTASQWGGRHRTGRQDSLLPQGLLARGVSRRDAACILATRRPLGQRIDAARLFASAHLHRSNNRPPPNPRLLDHAPTPLGGTPEGAARVYQGPRLSRQAPRPGAKR